MLKASQITALALTLPSKVGTVFSVIIDEAL